jgi:hypothetical protein
MAACSRAAGDGFSLRDDLEADLAARPVLDETWQIRRDHGGDLRITAGRAGIGEQGRWAPLSPGTWIAPVGIPSETMLKPLACSMAGPVSR